MLIRRERPGDEDAIHDLTATAFAPMSFADGTEAPIIRALRQAGDLTISLVAEVEDILVGHVAFSPLTIDGKHDNWFGLGPISVHPKFQREGIGKALINAGLDMLIGRGARGCALIGNPDIYRRVGFESDGELTYRNLPSSHVQRITFSGTAPRGELRFASAFENAENC